ncbi:hypothetical protein EJ02DRAFT_484965 [Clathrospora elynae]|uniref:Uncharacterized protein n=1 Tax=Clathrospora elynae TaxID=706981 RepID=A0A6A5SU46_9PLEO|nr:hypothetical protein EJ02DRAFT_484965 [Clathrospora elynae]
MHPSVAAIVNRLESKEETTNSHPPKIRQRAQSIEARTPPQRPRPEWYNTVPPRRRQASKKKKTRAPSNDDEQPAVLEVQQEAHVNALMGFGMPGENGKNNQKQADVKIEPRSPFAVLVPPEVQQEAHVNAMMGFGTTGKKVQKNQNQGQVKIEPRSPFAIPVPHKTTKDPWLNHFVQDFEAEAGPSGTYELPQRNPLRVTRKRVKNEYESHFATSVSLPRHHFSTPDTSPFRTSPSPERQHVRIASSPDAEAFYRTPVSNPKAESESDEEDDLAVPGSDIEEFAGMLDKILAPAPLSTSQTPSDNDIQASQDLAEQGNHYIPTGASQAQPPSYESPSENEMTTPSLPRFPSPDHIYTTSRLRDTASMSSFDLEPTTIRPETELSFLKPTTPTPFSTPHGPVNYSPYAKNIHCVPGSKLERLRRRTKWGDRAAGERRGRWERIDGKEKEKDIEEEGGEGGEDKERDGEESAEVKERRQGRREGGRWYKTWWEKCFKRPNGGSGGKKTRNRMDTVAEKRGSQENADQTPTTMEPKADPASPSPDTQGQGKEKSSLDSIDNSNQTNVKTKKMKWWQRRGKEVQRRRLAKRNPAMAPPVPKLNPRRRYNAVGRKGVKHERSMIVREV